MLVSGIREKPTSNMGCLINGGEWTFLAVHTVQPFLDERPISQGLSYEVREYRLRWWDKSVAHGEWSAIQKIAVGTA